MNVLEHPVINAPIRANVLAVLEAQCADAERQGRVLLRPELFFPEGAEVQLAEAHAWWPRDCPERLSWATSLGGALVMQTAASNTEPLLTHLSRQAAQVSAWLVSEKRDPAHPNEDRAERMRRRNRERVAEHRARAKKQGESAKASAWQQVQAMRRQRAVVQAEQDALVKAAYDAMTAASTKRAKVMTWHDANVAEAERIHREL